MLGLFTHIPAMVWAQTSQADVSARVAGMYDFRFEAGQAHYEAMAGPGYTRFTIYAKSADGSYSLKIAFSDQGLLKTQFAVPEEADCAFVVRKTGKTQRFQEHLNGTVHIDKLNADELVGRFHFYAAMQDATENHLRVKGRFVFASPL